MKKVFFFLFLLLAITMEIAFFPFWLAKGRGPDFVLVFVILWIIGGDFRKIWPGIILTGVALDFFSALPFGIISLALVLVCFLVDWLKKNIFLQSNLTVNCLLIAIGVLFYDLFLVGLGRLFELDLFFNLRYLPMELLFNFLTAAIFYGVLARFASFPA